LLLLTGSGEATSFTPARSLVQSPLGSGLALIDAGVISPRAGAVVLLSDSNTLCNEVPGKAWCTSIEQNKVFLLNIFSFFGKQEVKIGSISGSVGGEAGSFSEGAAFSRARELLRQDFSPTFTASDIITKEFLSGLDVFVYSSARTSVSGYRLLTQEEAANIFDFVRAGGHFLLIGDNDTFTSSAPALNNIAAKPFGVRYAGTIYGEYTLPVPNPGIHPILNQPFGTVTSIKQCYPGGMSFFAIPKPSSPPVADAGEDQSVPCAGPSGATVTLSAAKSVSPDGVALTYRWQGPFGTATGVTPTVSLPLGKSTITLIVEDANGEKAEDTVDIVVFDATPPVTAASLTGLAGDNGWYRSPVTVTLSATDCCSSVKSIRYSLDAAPEVTVPGNRAAFDVRPDGLHTVVYYGTDSGDVQEKPMTLHLKIDATPPRLQYTTTPPPNAAGWNNTDVTVTFAASDETSGIATYSAPVTLTAEGGGQAVTGYARDQAGNVTPVTATVSIDKTPPKGVLAVNQGILWPPNHKMVNVLISGSGTDTGSGVVSAQFFLEDEYGVITTVPAGFNTTIPLEAWREGTDMDGRHYTIRALLTDAAGNQTVETATVVVPHDMR
jgi:hypothetical protein